MVCCWTLILAVGLLTAVAADDGGVVVGIEWLPRIYLVIVVIRLKVGAAGRWAEDAMETKCRGVRARYVCPVLDHLPIQQPAAVVLVDNRNEFCCSTLP